MPGFLSESRQPESIRLSLDSPGMQPRPIDSFPGQPCAKRERVRVRGRTPRSPLFAELAVQVAAEVVGEAFEVGEAAGAREHGVGAGAHALDDTLVLGVHGVEELLPYRG